jgi:membrane-bound metal-dependent hydrolase YbcI (DUF457 family)
MTGKTHRMVGLTAGMGYLLLSQNPMYQPATFASTLVVSYLGSLLPDIDTSTGDIWHSLPFGHSVGKVAGSILQHRNITHSLLGFSFISWLVHLLFNLMPSYWGLNSGVLWIVFVVAYGSHLLADMLTVEGIPLLFPYGGMFGIPPKPFQGVRIVTGKWFENLVIFPAINLILIIMIISKWPEITTMITK